MRNKEKKEPSTVKELRKLFSELTYEQAEQLDLDIKKKIDYYQAPQMHQDISDYVEEQLIKLNIGKNHRLSKRCKKITASYLENEKIWSMQEGWFCVFAGIFTIASMILTALGIQNDWLNFGICFILLILWLFVQICPKCMNEKIEKFLINFNLNTPGWIMACLTAFYACVCFRKCCPWLCWIPIAVLMGGIVWYLRHWGKE